MAGGLLFLYCAVYFKVAVYFSLRCICLRPSFGSLGAFWGGAVRLGRPMLAHMSGWVTEWHGRPNYHGAIREIGTDRHYAYMKGAQQGTGMPARMPVGDEWCKED